MKKAMSILFALIMCISMIGGTCAAAYSEPQDSSDVSTTKYITAQDELNKYIKEHNIVLPEGKTLQAVKITVLNDPELVAKYNNIPDTSTGSVSSRGLSLSNRVYLGNYYYSDSPFLSDSIQGPMSTGPTLEFEHTTTAGFSGELGVTSSLITATFGVDFTEQIKVTRTFQFDPIPSGYYLVYSAFVNYAKYEFDVYNGSTYLGTSRYWTPVGIVITQELIG